jgi:hypothetical protein
MSLRAPRGAPKTDPPPADQGPTPSGARPQNEGWELRWALLGTLAVVAWLILCLALR